MRTATLADADHDLVTERPIKAGRENEGLRTLLRELCDAANPWGQSARFRMLLKKAKEVGK
jgi:hypothetical protein